VTPRELHRQQRDRIVASLLLADTRAERHGVYPARRPVRKPHAWTFPAVNENGRKL
jgi:hypothetical protein